MGLLDDAIREHLELKRLRGADPGTVAWEEKAALSPVSRQDGQAEQGGYDGSEVQISRGVEGPFVADPRSAVEPDSSAETDPSTGSQETIEINMEAELAAGAEPSHEHEPDATFSEPVAPVAHPAHTQTTTEDSLEWEPPSDHPEEPAGETNPDSEAKSHGGDDGGGTEHVEDVLEETPDFLRDTPEQERLWFEQRPPRDFDFNE